MIVFLDMDGVLADFTDSVCRLFGVSYDPFKFPIGGGFDALHQFLGVSRTKMWAEIKKHGHDFWHGIIPEPEAAEIFDKAKSFTSTNQIFILSHAFSENVIHGKNLWLRDHFPELASKTIYTEHKHLLAGKNRVLIDDKEENIDQFQAFGGHGILFPQPWNRCHGWIDRKVRFVESSLDRLRRVVHSK